MYANRYRPVNCHVRNTRNRMISVANGGIGSNPAEA